MDEKKNRQLKMAAKRDSEPAKHRYGCWTTKWLNYPHGPVHFSNVCGNETGVVWG